MSVDSLTDITLDGEQYRLVPGGYTRQPERAAPAPGEREQLSSFGFGLGLAQDDEQAGEQGGGWTALGVRCVGGGSGVEPFPSIASYADVTFTGVPTTTIQGYVVVTGNKAYLGSQRRIFQSVLLSNGTWADWTLASDLGVGFNISGLVYYQDDLLVMLSTGQDIRKFNTGTNSLTIWATGEKGQVGCGYAGNVMYAPRLTNGQEELRLAFHKWNGNFVTASRYLDSPIINMALFDSQVVIATKTSLYLMGGQPYPGEEDDPNATADTSKAPEWRGDPEPLLSHGVFAAGDDFVFLASWRGKLYTWLAGRVAEYDGGQVWTPMGPQGVVCYGGAAVGEWLVVALTAKSGNHELWGFDGTGWWRFLSRSSPEIAWPGALGGAGNRDLIVFRPSSTTYDLVRLRWRSNSVNTYATADANWVSPLLSGGDAGTTKAWRRVDVWFAWPELPGNPASADAVTIAFDYSIDAGATWTEIDSQSVTIAREHQLSHEFAVPPTSRLLQLRVRWSSVSDWAPILTHIDVDFALLDDSPRRQRWTLDVQVRDQLAESGRPVIEALWDAWREDHVLYRDIDYATTLEERTVRVLEVEEKAPQAGSGGQTFSGGIVTVTLSEL